MPRVDPSMSLDLSRDDFLLWIRWVAMESPETPTDPPGQGARVELQMNRRSVFGPQIFSRADLRGRGQWVLLDRCAWTPVLGVAPLCEFLDLQLIIHGSVANAPYLALYHLRAHQAPEHWDAKDLGTPLLQLQPSVPQGHWQVAGQANLRLSLRRIAPVGRLPVL